MSSENRTDNRPLWVIVAILAFFFLIFFVFTMSIVSIISGSVEIKEAIGVIEIKGTIEKADQTVMNIRKMNEDELVKAVLIRIDSPGGSVSASQEMMEAIRSIRKPVAISMGGMAASGGYYVACAGPRIFANPGTLTGSIGVISQSMEFSELLDFLDIKVNTVKTGDLKDSGSPFREFTREDRAYFEDLGLHLYDQFVTQVSESRNLPREKVLSVADGRVLSGKQALEAGLVDELGGMYAAVEYLRKAASLPEDVALKYPPSSSNELFQQILTEGGTTAGKALVSGAEELLNGSTPFQYLYKP